LAGGEAVTAEAAVEEEVGAAEVLATGEAVAVVAAAGEPPEDAEVREAGVGVGAAAALRRWWLSPTVTTACSSPAARRTRW